MLNYFYVSDLETSRGVDEEHASRPSSFNFNGMLTMRSTSKRRYADVSIKEMRDSVSTGQPLCVSLNDASVEGDDSQSHPMNGRQSLFESADRVSHLSVGGADHTDSGLSGLGAGSSKFIDVENFGVTGGSSLSRKATSGADSSKLSTSPRTGTGSATKSGSSKGIIQGTLKRGNLVKSGEVLEF